MGRIFLLFLFIGSASAQENKSIAVLDIQGNGISLVEARTLSDELRTKLFQMEVYNVVERGNMEAILSEQGFQQSGCTTSECAVEAGQLLGVQKMVAGSVGKIGSLYNVNVRMFDVETGRIENNVSKRYEGKIEGLLDLMGEICEELVEQNLEGQNDSIGEEKEKPPIDNTINQVEKHYKPLNVESGWGIFLGMNYFRFAAPKTEAFATDNFAGEIGGFFRLKLASRFFLQFELMYSAYDFLWRASFTESRDMSGGATMSYLKIPILINYKIISFTHPSGYIVTFLGPGISVLLNDDFRLSSIHGSEKEANDLVIALFVGFVIGGGPIYFDFRYEKGLTEMFNKFEYTDMDLAYPYELVTVNKNFKYDIYTISFRYWF